MDVPGLTVSDSQVETITDDGDADRYGEGTGTKDLDQDE